MFFTLNDGIWKLFRSLNFKLFQSSSNFSWIDCGWHICEVIVILPSSSFDDLEGHLLWKTIPVIDIRASVNTPDGKIGADLDAFEGVNS